MKHFNSALLLSLLFCFFATFSFGQGANLTVMTEGGEYFNLKLDGRVMNSEPHQTMLFEGLAPGFYRLQIDMAVDGQEVIQLKKSVNMEPGQHYKYRIKTNRNGEYVMRIFAIQPIMVQPGQNMPPPPSAEEFGHLSPGFNPGQHTGSQPNLQWDDMGSMTINGATVRMSFMDFAGTGMSVQAGSGGASMTVTDGMGTHMTVDGSHAAMHTSTEVHHSGGHVQASGAQVGDCPQPMPQSTFNQEFALVRQLRNDATIMAQVEKLMNQHCMTSTQITQMLGEINLLSNRVMVAKTGWHLVFDPDNYHFVFDALVSRSFISELQAYMAAHPIGTVQADPSFQDPGLQQPPPAVSFVPGYTGPIGCPGPVMALGQFQQSLASIRNRSFADEQKTVARQMLRGNCLTVNQVKQLLQVFSFEDDKLEIAKLAYGSTYDIGNYYMVNDVFTFSSSTEELDQFLNGR